MTTYTQKSDSLLYSQADFSIVNSKQDGKGNRFICTALTSVCDDEAECVCPLLSLPCHCHSRYAHSSIWHWIRALPSEYVASLLVAYAFLGTPVCLRGLYRIWALRLFHFQKCWPMDSPPKKSRYYTPGDRPEAWGRVLVCYLSTCRTF